jgi:hypothetical protein
VRRSCDDELMPRSDYYTMGNIRVRVAADSMKAMEWRRAPQEGE